MDETCCIWGCDCKANHRKLTEMAYGCTSYLYYCDKHWVRHQSREELESTIETLRTHLSELEGPEMVTVRREDLEMAIQFLFCRKSLPLVGPDRTAGNRLKAALEKKP